MEIDFTLDQLPEHILGEIFSFVAKKENLRLACKSFKDIIDNSAQLMKDKWLVVDNVLNVDPRTINHHYQKIKLSDLSFEALNWLCYYHQKNRIKSVKIKCIKKGIVRPLSVQYVITNFNFMETLYIESNYSENDGDSPISQLKLIPNKLSNLKTLHIGYMADYPNNVLDMMSEIPTIKNLHIHDFDILRFPNDVKWKLEKLILPDVFFMTVDDNNCNEFLLSQQSSLKKLTFPESFGFTSFIMRNLPNLENLTLGLEYNEEINTEFLMTNGRLERLFLERFFWETDDIFKALLDHYNRIKFLSIHCTRETKLFNGNFLYLTHLMLKGTNSLRILNGSFPNLKVLGISIVDTEDEFNADDISNEAIKNIQKLCLEVWDVNQIFEVIEKCSQISHFNLNIPDWNSDHDPFFVSSIDEILEVLPQLKCLGITNKNLTVQNVKYNKLMGHIKNKRLILRIYKHFKSMIAEDWGSEDAKTI